MSVASHLEAACAVRDRAQVAHCVHLFLTDAVPLASLAERVAAVDALLGAVQTFKQPAFLAPCLAAMAHAAGLDTPIPVAAILRAVRPHERDLQVVQSASRLCSEHVSTPRVLQDLPLLAQAAARWLTNHPRDQDVAYWAAHVLLQAAAQEPNVVSSQHGSFGAGDVAVAVVTGATAVRTIQVYVAGRPWTCVLETLYPRLR